MGTNCPLCGLGQDLQAIVDRLASELYTPEIVRLRASWSDDLFDNFNQHDVTEALSLLLSSLEDAEARVLPPGLPAGIWELMGVRSLQKLVCNTCGGDFPQDVQLLSIALDIPLQPEHVDHLFTQYWCEQVLKKGDDPYRCPVACIAVEPHVRKFEKVRKWPQVIILTLKRWAYTKDGLCKINTKVHHDDRLRLADQTNHYRICGLIQHHGIARAGHYIAYVRGSGDTWIFCDDECPPLVVPLQSVLNAEAYVLMYQRESIAPDAVPPDYIQEV